MHLLKVMLKSMAKRALQRAVVLPPCSATSTSMRWIGCWSERGRYQQWQVHLSRYARFADDLVILIDAYKRHDWLIGAVEKRLREEFDKLQVEINDEKSRVVDLGRGENSASWASTSLHPRLVGGGAWQPRYAPSFKKRTALMRALKQVFPPT